MAKLSDGPSWILKINLLAESETTADLIMLRQLCSLHKLDVRVNSDLGELLRRTEPKELPATLRYKLPDLWAERSQVTAVPETGGRCSICGPVENPIDRWNSNETTHSLENN